MTKNIHLTVVGFLFAVACTTPNPNSRRPDANAEPVHCVAGCAAPTGVCDLTTNICVQCTAAEPGACTGNTPVCGSDNACHGCTRHIECASRACRPDGSCAAPEDVAYVDPQNGTVNSSCARTEPCPTITTALITKKPFIKTIGTTIENVAIADQDVALLADPGTKLVAAQQGTVIAIAGNSNVSIYDLEIVGGSGPQGNGIAISGNASIVSLSRVYIHNNSYYGVNANGNRVYITYSEISDNGTGGVMTALGKLTISESILRSNRNGGSDGNGVYLLGGSLVMSHSEVSLTGGHGIQTAGSEKPSLTITRSKIFSNTAGGIYMAAPTTFDITSNFICRNGSLDYLSIGGIQLTLNNGFSNKLLFNTIVGNIHYPSRLSDLRLVGGVSYIDFGEIVANNNLIAGNVRKYPDQVVDSQVYDTRVFGNSYIGNAIETRWFVSSDKTPYDYHLTADTPSTIRDSGECADVPVDIDGDPRPLNDRCDLGADEYRAVRP